VIEEAQIVLHKADEPHLLADLLDADVLSGEHGAEVDLAFSDADTPTVGRGALNLFEPLGELK